MHSAPIYGSISLPVIAEWQKGNTDHFIIGRTDWLDAGLLALGHSARTDLICPGRQGSVTQNLQGLYWSCTGCHTARSPDPGGQLISGIDCSLSTSVEARLISQHWGLKGNGFSVKLSIGSSKSDVGWVDASGHVGDPTRVVGIWDLKSVCEDSGSARRKCNCSNVKKFYSWCALGGGSHVPDKFIEWWNKRHYS